MPLDRHARRFLELARASAQPDSAEPSLEDMRRAAHALAAFSGADDRPVEARDATLPCGPFAISARFYAPMALRERVLPALVYFHGGGWLSGDLDTHDGVCRALAHEGRCRVVSIAYRLAPEHRFPTGLSDCVAALAAVRAQANDLAIDPARLGVAGDSAGGNLAAVVCRSVSGENPPLALQLLLCPVLDALGRMNSRRELASGYLIEERAMRRYFDCYRTEGLDADDPRVSPLRADDFHGLPPTRIHTAEFDPLCDEAALYADRLAAAGIDVKLTRHPGLIHHFYGLDGIIPAAKEALAAVGRDIREALA